MIHDQYTDRKDLTSFQKWNLRHPGKRAEHYRNWSQAHREQVAAYIRAWRDENMDKMNGYSQKRRKKIKNAKVDNWRTKAMKVVTNTGSTSIAKRKEILHLHSRGKDIGMIAVWTHTPVSVVLSIIAASQQPLQNLGAKASLTDH